MITRDPHWLEFNGGSVYRLLVWIAPDYSVFVGNLPGCVSQGESIEECLKNIEEAFRGCVETYHESKQPIPWEHGKERPLFHEERVILVDVSS